MQFQFNQIRKVHLEIVDKCNAKCPMCPRSENGGPEKSFINKNEITLERAKQIFDVSFLQQLRFVQLCGNFGDPIAARETLEVLTYFREVNPQISLGVHTNGSARHTSWWTKLGELLSHPGDYCKFGMDGLRDTNAIYRRNTDWDKIIDSTTAFIKAGGYAHWEYLVFQHNEHQIEEARQLSKDMGFREFYVKKTSRFYNYKTGKNEDYPIYDLNRNTIGYLKAPTEEKLTNSVSLNYKNIEPVKTEQFIDCQSIKEGEIYISARGEVFPCCFVGGELFYSMQGAESQHLRKKFFVEGETMENLVAGGGRSVKDAYQSSFFNYIESEFGNGASNVQSCKRICTAHRKIVLAEYQ